MTWLRTIAHEIIGLFVDDGSLALLILLWLAVSFFLFPHLGLPAQWKGLALFAGLAALLLASAVRYARRQTRS